MCIHIYRVQNYEDTHLLLSLNGRQLGIMLYGMY